MTIQIRSAQAPDIDAVSDYFKALYATPPDTVFYRTGIPIEALYGMITNSLNSPDKLFLIACLEQAVVGSLTFERYGKLEMAHGGEFGMAVHPLHRGLGIGQKLLEGLEAWAKVQRIERLDLQVWSNNRAGIHLYEKSGFTQDGVRKNAIKRDGQIWDIVLMSKELKT